MEEETTIVAGANLSAMLQRNLPKKCPDPGVFGIPCVIGDTHIAKAMMDLGASINVMPLSMYREMKIGGMRDTRVAIQLADRSVVHPEGFMEDVLVRVGDLIFPADFYVLDMMDRESRSGGFLLGRPFMCTAKTIIDCATGKLTFEFGGKNVEFDVLGSMKGPGENEVVSYLDCIEDAVCHKGLRLLLEDQTDLVIQESIFKSTGSHRKFTEQSMSLIQKCVWRLIFNLKASRR